MTTPPPELTLWAFGDAHVGTDVRHGRESLADALRQSEDGGPNGAPPIPWHLAIDIGDMSGGQETPKDDEGEELIRQLGAMHRHRREQIYHICGNHDRSGLGEPPAVWWRKWVDPLGEFPQFSGVHAERRPYPIEGTWERYSFRVGNLLFLMMSDINEPSQSIGRGDLGGNPGGVVAAETFAWWREQVEANPDSIIISAHHYMLKDTTVASGEWEGVRRDAPTRRERSHYHGWKDQGTPRGASYLYWVGSKPDAQAFEGYLAEHTGAVALWLGGHTHTHPDDTHGNKPHVATRWGTHFVNVAALTRYHGDVSVAPMSRVFTFTAGCDLVRCQCYMHSADWRRPGFYPEKETMLRLSRPYQPTP